MPITLTDDSTEQVIDIAGARITYVEANGDHVMRALRRAVRERAVGADDDDLLISTDIAIVAGCVLDWSGVVDAAGAPVPWPAVGCAVSSSTRAAPTAEHLAARVELIRHLPAVAIRMLDSAVSKPIALGAESGKG